MPSEKFTRREQDVLSALSALPFRSQAEIAIDLGISARTLRSHISNMLAKSGMCDQRELVVTELHRRMAHRDVTRMSRAGRRLAVVTVTPIAPVTVADAITALGAGKTVYVMSQHVQSVLEGLGSDD